MNTLSVSDLTAADIPAVLEISQECGLCLWSADAYRSELARSDSIMLRLADEDSNLAGFAVGRIFDFGNGQRSIELTNIGLRETFRGQGFGEHLLKSFLGRCRRRHVRMVVLEVRQSNVVAIAFYRKFGFQKTGRRRGFYSNPSEDALTMRLTLTADRAAKI